MSEDRAARRRLHWKKTSRLTYIVLAIWFVFGFVTPWFAKDLDSMSFLGFELGYYMIVQGSLIVFVLLIIVQNMIQDKIDDEFDAGEG